MIRGLVLVLAMAACAQGAEIDPQLSGPFVLHAGEPSAVIDGNAGEPEQAPSAPAPCEMAFDPDPELLAVTKAAAARWSTATGCDVRVETGGVAINAWYSLFVEYREDGRALLSSINHGGTMRHICGLSTWDDAGEAVRIIDVSQPYPGCEDAEWSVMHEMFHALVGVRGHTESGVGANGNDPDKSPRIDEASLSAVCASLDCSTFEPESD